MSRLTFSEALVAVNNLGDIIIETRKALAEAKTATAEALRIAAPLAEETAALKLHVTSLEASLASFDKADADLDAAISSQLERVAQADAPPAETPVTDESGSVIPGPDTTSEPTPEVLPETPPAE